MPFVCLENKISYYSIVSCFNICKDDILRSLLLSQIADHVGFKYNVELVPDNNYGALNLSTGQWNGLVRVG